MKTKTLVISLLNIICLLLLPNAAFTQVVSINASGNASNSSAILDVSSTTQGVLIPRMNDADRIAIPAPAIGLLIYNTTTNKLNYYKSTGWYELSRIFQSLSTGTNNPGVGVAINETGAAPDSSAILDVSSTTRGLLIPRTIESSLTPVTGLIYYDNSMDKLRYHDGVLWETVCETFISTNTGTGNLSSLGVAINATGNGADPSTMLDVKSDTKGLLIPRMTATDRGQILPVTGLIIYNTTTNTIDYYTGTDWSKLGTDAPVTPGPISGTATVCDGQTGVTYSIPSVPDATSYTWSVPPGATITSGQGTTSITVNFGSSSGNISVTAGNICGNSAASTLTITVCGGHTTAACGGGTMTDSRDGKIYTIKDIGPQCWMTQNLNYSATGMHTNLTTDGCHPIGQGAAGIQKYCYNDIEANCTAYGGLYEWGEVMDGVTVNNTNADANSCNGCAACPPCTTPVQGVCPSGWHLPSHYEWVLLEKNIGSSPGSFPYDETTAGALGTDEGNNMKKVGAWPTGGVGTNTSGFTAIPSGKTFVGYPCSSFRYNTASPSEYSAYWYSSTQSTTNLLAAWIRQLDDGNGNAKVATWNCWKTEAVSVRCVKN